MDVFYFSNVTNNTARFVESLIIKGSKNRIEIKDPLQIEANSPYILITPTYGDHEGKGMVPHQVKTFLNNEVNAKLLRGVIATGNRNFGKDYAMAGKIIAHRFSVPLLYELELAGTKEDIDFVSQIIQQLEEKAGARK